jgi:hypothetical protein
MRWTVSSAPKRSSAQCQIPQQMFGRDLRVADEVHVSTRSKFRRNGGRQVSRNSSAIENTVLNLLIHFCIRQKSNLFNSMENKALLIGINHEKEPMAGSLYSGIDTLPAHCEERIQPSEYEVNCQCS